MSAAVVASMLAGACGAEQLDGGAACSDLADGVANHALGCSGNEKQARQVRDTFESGYACRTTNEPDALDAASKCSAALRAVPCDSVVAGLETWMTAAPACLGVLEGPGIGSAPDASVEDAGADTSAGDGGDQ